MVVDDHDDLRAIFAEVLASEGWDVRAFATAADALASIRDDPPDVLLTDINLGGLSGLGLARAVRVDPRTEHVGLVAASNSVSPTPGMMRVFDVFLVKPVELPTLGATLQKVVEQSTD